jgi:hypothetical protein
LSKHPYLHKEADAGAHLSDGAVTDDNTCMPTASASRAR